jgi:hypothetical protein
MNWQRSIRLGLFLLLGGAVLACSDDKKKNNNPTEPQEPVPVITETFRGEIGQLETDCHFFSLTNIGDITIQITELEPLGSITLGLALGTPAMEDPTACADFADDRSVRLLEVFTSTTLQPGAYCTCIGDVGNIFPDKTVTYAYEVTHP